MVYVTHIGLVASLLDALCLIGWFFLGVLPFLGRLKNKSLFQGLLLRLSLASVTCELKWLKGLLLSLEVQHPKAMSLY